MLQEANPGIKAGMKQATIAADATWNRLQDEKVSGSEASQAMDSLGGQIHIEQLKEEEEAAATMQLQEAWKELRDEKVGRVQAEKAAESLRGQLAKAVSSAEAARRELQQERNARSQTEKSAGALAAQLKKTQHDGDQRFAEATKAIQGFRAEMDKMKKSSKQAQASIKEKQALVDKVLLPPPVPLWP
jgi:hypothetical protein